MALANRRSPPNAVGRLQSVLTDCNRPKAPGHLSENQQPVDPFPQFRMCYLPLGNIDSLLAVAKEQMLRADRIAPFEREVES